MISEETAARLRTLLADQLTYRPRADILTQIADKRVICFVGATGMGKTTIMHQLAREDSQFGEFSVFTSREPRPEDNRARYTYYQHTDESLAGLLNRIEKGEVLQYNINPFSLLVYGSEVDGYPYAHNLGDVFASSIDGFRQLGFGEVQVFSVVTDPDSWLQRFNARFPSGNPQREARRLEAISSLEWSLAQTNADHAWVINRDGHIGEATKAITGRHQAKTEAVELAQACLTAIRELAS